MHKSWVALTCRVELQAVDPFDPGFLSDLASEGLLLAVVEEKGDNRWNYDIVVYGQDYDTLRTFVEKWFYCGDTEMDLKLAATIERA